MSIQARFPKLFAVTLIVTILAGIVPIATMLSQARDEDWPMLQTNLQRTG